MMDQESDALAEGVALISGISAVCGLSRGKLGNDIVRASLSSLFIYKPCEPYSGISH
jgi:hypothetical protein